VFGTLHLLSFFIDKSNQYIDFLNHSLIVEKNGKYELSLFGITMVLFINNYFYYYDKDSPFTGEHLPLFKFEWDDDDIIKDYDNVAYHYSAKLPLVFGKWTMLKHATVNDWLDPETEHIRAMVNSFTVNRKKCITVPTIIDIIRVLFNRDHRKKCITVPTMVGGFKEYYDNVQVLARNTSLKLEETYNALKTVLEQEQEEYSNEKALRSLLYRKLNEIGDTLMFTDVDRFIRNLYEKALEDPNIAENILKRLESRYANEISFLLYLIMGSVRSAYPIIA
jgi:hypothetical protein